MDSEVFLCGYSYHSKPVNRGSKSKGLWSYLFRLQTEGTCIVQIEGEDFRIEPGDLLLLEPGVMYNMRTEEKTGSGDYYLFCSGTWLDQWWVRSGKPRKIRIKIADSLLYPWRQIIKEKRRLNEENKELTHCLLQVLCLTLDRFLSDSNSAYSRSHTAMRMKQFIEQNAHRAFKVEEVAKHARLSVSRASHFFKECYGHTMMEYALEVRLAAAIKRMKHSHMSLEQIADNCGFGSYTYFFRAFKRRYGLSPAAFRKMD